MLLTLGVIGNINKSAELFTVEVGEAYIYHKVNTD
jgi:hypothetical protein